MKTQIKIKDRYYIGVGSFVASELNFSEKYVRDVLRGVHDKRKTQAVSDIKRCAVQFKRKQIKTQ